MDVTQQNWVLVSLAEQTLTLYQGNNPQSNWPVATGKAGAGELRGSGGTPRGWHRVRLAIGATAPRGAVFVGRRWTGEIHTPTLHKAFPNRDWILSRVLWLTGLESGRNRGGQVDTLSRFIYIHGCPDEAPLGQPISHGCIRMGNDAVIALFDLIGTGTLVRIVEGA
ncbi:L,D-transpeptidase [Spiribacter salilacus]|uniref:L,D-transpeptidase n=1 Tax=Spiribacter salilacus TaxID=2664894 RepID=UPI00129A664A|nr:L,D-transpeptidase [Spiribacter salilacus]